MTDTLRSPDPGFWAGKRVLLTGHTGFKGAWAALFLRRLGADVTGFALPPGSPSLFGLAGVEQDVRNVLGDLRKGGEVESVIKRCDPQIVLHLAAQPLVRQSFAAPVETFATNVMGTIHLLESLRSAAQVKVIVVVTTDKVYANDESGRPFAENDRLGGHDPYAASKAAVEVAAASYAASFFEPRAVPLATARGGNVIGGGDFSEDRIVPDIWRAARTGTPVALRNPDATRPWQHVLDCLCGYLLYIEDLACKPASTPRALNFGPDSAAEITVSSLVEEMQTALDSTADWTRDEGDHPHEMRRLSIDSRLAREKLGWHDRWPGEAAIRATASWYESFADGADMRAVTSNTILDYGIG